MFTHDSGSFRAYVASGRYVATLIKKPRENGAIFPHFLKNSGDARTMFGLVIDDTGSEAT